MVDDGEHRIDVSDFLGGKPFVVLFFELFVVCFLGCLSSPSGCSSKGSSIS